MISSEIYTDSALKVAWKVCPCGRSFPSLQKRVRWCSEKCRVRHKSTLGGKVLHSLSGIFCYCWRSITLD